MRSLTLAALAGAALVALTAPASAAWKGYISHPLGFAFAMPGEMKVEKGKYQGAVAGPHDSMIFRSVDDNIEYKVTVTNFVQAQAESATILGEAAAMFQEGKRVVMDTFDLVEQTLGRPINLPSVC